MSTNKYNINYFINNHNEQNCEVNYDNNSLLIKPIETDKKIIIKWDDIQLDIGVYIFDINIETETSETLENIGSMFFNNNEYKLQTGKNNIDIYITYFKQKGSLIFKLLSNNTYKLDNFNISTNVNDVLFETCDTAVFEPSEENNEKVKTEINISNNNIYPTDSVQRRRYVSKPKNITRHIQTRKIQQEPIKQPATESIKQESIKQPVKVVQKITRSKNNIKSVKKQVLQNIDTKNLIHINKLYLLNENQSLKDYYINQGIDCMIINKMDIPENVKNKEIAEKIKQILYILNNAIKNKYQYIMIMNDNIYPNINNKLFISKGYLNQEFNVSYDYISLFSVNNNIEAFIVKKTMFNVIIQTICNYLFSFETYIKNIISSGNYKTINSQNKYFYLTSNLNSVDAINYVYFIKQTDKMDDIKKSLVSIANQSNTNIYLSVYYPEVFNEKQNFVNKIKPLLPVNSYINYYSYTDNFENYYDIIKYCYQNINQKYLTIFTPDFVYKPGIIAEFNKIIQNNYDFINCGYTIKNKEVKGEIYTPETFLYSDLIQLFILKIDIIQYCLDTNIFNFYKKVLFNNTNNAIIYDSYAIKINEKGELKKNGSPPIENKNDLQYETITENNKQLDEQSSQSDDFEMNQLDDIPDSDELANSDEINENQNKDEQKKEPQNNYQQQIIPELKLELFDLSKDTILCYYSSNSIYNQRLYNICCNLQKYYNIIIVADSNYYDKNIMYIYEQQLNKCIEEIKVNKIILLLSDLNIFNKINTEMFNDIIYDIVEYNSLTKLNSYIQKISFITYSNINFVDLIKNSINDNSSYYIKNNKYLPQILYIPNCINNYNVQNNIKPELLRNNKKNITYIGPVNYNLDFNIIKTIANNSKKLGVSLNIINTLKINDENKLMFKDDNIHWLDISDNNSKSKLYSYTGIDNEIQRYILYSDIIIFPYNNDENIKYDTPKEFNIAMYHKKPIISTYDYTLIEKYTKQNESSVFETTNWIETIQKIIQELNCNIIYDYKSYNDKLWYYYTEQLYKTIQSNENLFLSSVSNKIIKTCAIISDMFNGDDFIYGYKQYMILCVCEILKNNGIIPSIFQVSNYKQHTKISFKGEYYKVKFIINDDLYTLNNYDCTIYDSLAFEFIKNINPNSIYLNFDFSKSNLSSCDKFINSSILTLTNNKVFNMIYSFIKDNQNNHKIYYIPGFYIDKVENEKENKEETENKINNEIDSINVMKNDKETDKETVSIQEIKHVDETISDPIIKQSNLTINIIYYLINKNNITTINNILTQISNKNIKFNVRLTVKPNSGVKELLNNLKEKDERFDYTYISSFEKLIEFYDEHSISLFVNNDHNLYLEYYNAIYHGSIVITSNNNSMTSQLIDNFNCLILESANINTVIEKLKYAILHYNDIKQTLINGREYVTKNYNFNQWNETMNKIFYNIAWIYNKFNTEIETNYLIDMNKDNITTQYKELWKNYAHSLNIQGYYKSLETDAAVRKHFDVNQNISLKVGNIDKKIMILVDNNKYSDISYLINNISQYIKSDIYVYTETTKEIKYNDFIYDIIPNINKLKETLKKYELVLYFNLQDKIMKEIVNSGIQTIQYIYDTSDINPKYLSYSFPSRIISHSPYIANYMSYKYNLIPTIIPYPIKYMIDPENPENKEHKIKKRICCFTTLNEQDGIEIFLKMIKRYQIEYEPLNEKFDINIYYYPYNNDYLQLLRNKTTILDIDINFIEMKKNIDYYIFNSDLIIIPILHNYLPILLLKALLYNKNIMISSQYSIREFNTLININGFDNLLTIFRQNDVANLKNCFVKWCNNKFEENVNESEYVKKFYKPELFVNKLIDIIRFI